MKPLFVLELDYAKRVRAQTEGRSEEERANRQTCRCIRLWESCYAEILTKKEMKTELKDEPPLSAGIVKKPDGDNRQSNLALYLARLDMDSHCLNGGRVLASLHKRLGVH